jgi:glycosyltransferase involved in cell wall biosynthesis
LTVATRPIVVISQVPPPTHGSTLITKILLEVLVELGENVILVDRRFSQQISEVGAVSFRKIVAAPGLAVRLLQVLLFRRPQMCVFFSTNRSFSFLVDVVLGELLRLFRVPTINYVHTRGYSDLADRGAAWRFLVGRLLGRASATVCLADALIADIRPFVGAGTVSVIKNTSETPPTDHGPRRRGHVLFLSNLLEEKGADVFVDTAIELCALDEGLRFTLVGPTVDEALTAALRARVAKSGHSARIVFRGPLFGPEKWDMLASAEVLVFPTRYRFEAQPLTIIEAFSVGVPVVASDVGGISELVDDGVNGRLVVAATVEPVTQAVLSVTSDPATSDSLARGALRTYDQQHSRDAYRADWARVVAGVRK